MQKLIFQWKNKFILSHSTISRFFPPFKLFQKANKRLAQIALFRRLGPKSDALEQWTVAVLSHSEPTLPELRPENY